MTMQRQRHKPHPEDDMTYACPVCEASKFLVRYQTTPKYRCREGHEFDEPIERERASLIRPDTDAATLEQASPGEVGLTPEGER